MCLVDSLYVLGSPQLTSSNELQVCFTRQAREMRARRFLNEVRVRVAREARDKNTIMVTNVYECLRMLTDS